MDKYEGINRAEVRLTPTEYLVVKRKALPRKKERKSLQGSTGGFLIRCGVCAMIVLICVAGKFSSFGAAKRASDFIKDELNRDIIASVSELIDDKANT